MNTHRRTFIQAAAWTAPVVTVASAAPAYATSENPPKPQCSPIGYKKPGLGHNTKDYFVLPNCDGETVLSVHIDNKQAKKMKNGYWAIFGQKDSRSKLLVTVTFSDGQQWQGIVFFPPKVI